MFENVCGWSLYKVEDDDHHLHHRHNDTLSRFEMIAIKDDDDEDDMTKLRQMYNRECPQICMSFLLGLKYIRKGIYYDEERYVNS